MAEDRSLNLIMLGIGGVGRSLIRQIVQHRAQHAERYGLSLRVAALVDSRALLAGEGDGLSDATLLEVLEAKGAGLGLDAFESAQPVTQPVDAVARLRDRLGAQSVVVDCSATEATTPALLQALECGCAVVLANKKPLTTTQETFDRLTRAGATGGVLQPGRVRYETTCGAGLPVIVTLQRLLASGDTVDRIAGALSGTLGYVMTGLQQGRPYSEVVREAHQLGYTEPDPRDDLGGVDVARKALILARTLGWQLEMADVEVQGLYPPHMAHLSVAQFMAALPQLDALFAAQVEQAAEQGGVLRYAALVQEGRCTVGPTVVSAQSPLGRLQGTGNLIEFHTNLYSPNPLVVQGPGAGADVTAAGVLSDIVELALAC